MLTTFKFVLKMFSGRTWDTSRLYSGCIQATCGQRSLKKKGDAERGRGIARPDGGQDRGECAAARLRLVTACGNCRLVFCRLLWYDVVSFFDVCLLSLWHTSINISNHMSTHMCIHVFVCKSTYMTCICLYTSALMSADVSAHASAEVSHTILQTCLRSE